MSNNRTPRGADGFFFLGLFQMSDDHQRLIELLDFSRHAPTVRGNEQLKTYLKTHPLPALLDVRGIPPYNLRTSYPVLTRDGHIVGWVSDPPPRRVTPIFHALYTGLRRLLRYRWSKRIGGFSGVLRNTIDILLRAGDNIDAPSFMEAGHDSQEMYILCYLLLRKVDELTDTINDLVEFLLKRGANPNKAVHGLSFFGNGPVAPLSLLHLTVAQGNLKGVHLLVKYGANVNIRGIGGRTPIFVAVSDHNMLMHNNTGMVKLLLRAGASATLTDVYGSTPLHVLFRQRLVNSYGHSYRERFFETLRLLMDHGANPRKKDNQGWTVLSLVEKWWGAHGGTSVNRNRISTILMENRVTARYALNKHLIPNNVVQQILHRAGLTEVNELQGKRRNQEIQRNRHLVKRLLR